MIVLPMVGVVIIFVAMTVYFAAMMDHEAKEDEKLRKAIKKIWEEEE